MTLTIRHKFLIYTLGIVLAVAAGLAIRSINNAHDREIVEFDLEARTVTNMLVGSVANDLYFLDLASIHQKLRSIRINPNILSVHVFDSKGAELAENGREGHSDNESLVAQLIGEASQTQTLVSRRDGALLRMAMPILISDESLIGYVAVRFSLDRVDARMAEATRSVLLSTAVAVMLACVLAVVAGWHFTRPLLAITNTAIAVSGGALTARSMLKQSDEIGQLSAAINEMADHLVERLTDLEATQSDLRAAKEGAERANKAKSEFLANMSHELRTPLNAIIGFSQLMSAEYFGPHSDARYREYAQDIDDSGQHLLAVINDILDLSKAEAGLLDLEQDTLKIKRVIAAAVRVVHGRVEAAELKLTVKDSVEEIYLWGDERKIKQILLNLLSNAIKFTPAGGSIEITTAIDSENGLSLSVRDTGIGVEPDDIAKIVEPFVQVDTGLNRRYEGTGLGLSLVRTFAEMHGGRLSIESVRGIGTTVTVYFPPDRIRKPMWQQAFG